MLDLAHHLISDRGWPTPDTNREAFEVLVEQGVLSEELGEQMARWASLRDLLVPPYLNVDHGVLWDIMQRDLDQLEEYARAVRRAALE